jgi:hypothetical protein
MLRIRLNNRQIWKSRFDLNDQESKNRFSFSNQ